MDSIAGNDNEKRKAIEECKMMNVEGPFFKYNIIEKDIEMLLKNK